MGELLRALMAFNEALDAWLSQGGDDRLKGFTPLKAWAEVVSLAVEAAKERRDVR